MPENVPFRPGEASAETTAPASDDGGPTRRTALTAGAWAIPAVTLAASSPAFATSEQRRPNVQMTLMDVAPAHPKHQGQADIAPNTPFRTVVRSVNRGNATAENLVAHITYAQNRVKGPFEVAAPWVRYRMDWTSVPDRVVMYARLSTPVPPGGVVPELSFYSTTQDAQFFPNADNSGPYRVVARIGNSEQDYTSEYEDWFYVSR